MPPTGPKLINPHASKLASDYEAFDPGIIIITAVCGLPYFLFNCSTKIFYYKSKEKASAKKCTKETADFCMLKSTISYKRDTKDSIILLRIDEEYKPYNPA